MGELIEVIGQESASKLCATYGGCQLSIPADIGEEHKISQTIGLIAATKLSYRYGHCSIVVPRMHMAHLAERNTRIKADRRAGAPLNDLAIKYQLTSRQITTIINRINP